MRAVLFVAVVSALSVSYASAWLTMPPVPPSVHAWCVKLKPADKAANPVCADIHASR